MFPIDSIGILNCDSIQIVKVYTKLSFYLLSLFYSIQIDFLITKIRIKNINEGMVRRGKLGNIVKKETVSEDNKEEIDVKETEFTQKETKWMETIIV